MMRKNVKRAVLSANGGMSSRTMYRSRTRNLTALLYHSDVHRLSQLLAVALVLAALAGLGDAAFGASGVPDRLDRFRELALVWQGRVQTGAELTADGYREMYALLDEEIVESLTSGGPYASPGFLQDRLDAFGGVWGGTTLGVVGVDHLVVGAFQLADATDVNTVRVYGRLHGEAALLGTLHREGRPVVHRAAAAPGEAPQFVAAWEGAPSGRGTRALRLELARQVGDGVRVVWSTAELFPDGLLARSYSVRPNEIRVRYELRYPGWTPGCEARTEAEDLRSEEHTSELQSPVHLVCRLLLEKKKKNTNHNIDSIIKEQLLKPHRTLSQNSSSIISQFSRVNLAVLCSCSSDNAYYSTMTYCAS